MPSEFQLMVLLAFLWTEGDGMSDKKDCALFCLSTGAAKDSKDCVAKAIVEVLYSKTVFWPDKEERWEISHRFQADFQLPILVGVADRTLFPLLPSVQREPMHLTSTDGSICTRCLHTYCE
jgi:hypothetical protein